MKTCPLWSHCLKGAPGNIDYPSGNSLGLAPACADPPRCTACLLFIIRHEFSGLEFGGLDGWDSIPAESSSSKSISAESSSADSISADSRSVDSSSSESSELLRLEIRRFKGVRSEMQIWMFGGSAVQSSEVHCFRVQTFGSLQFQKCIG